MGTSVEPERANEEPTSCHMFEIKPQQNANKKLSWAKLPLRFPILCNSQIAWSVDDCLSPPEVSCMTHGLASG